MHLAETIAVLLVVAAVVAGFRARRRARSERVMGRGRLRHGATRYYSRRNFLKLAGATGGAALFAYSGADESLEQWHHERVETLSTDGASEIFKRFGERYWAGIWVAMAIVDRVVASTAVSRFGRRCFEATAIGLPSMWTVQRTLGAARPSDHTHGPRFRPLADDNTVSGHTFIAAIPCLVLVRQLRVPWARALAGFASTLTGWSRLHDRRHYPSQVLFGWAMAWEATGAVCGGDPADDQSRAEASSTTPSASS